jgi:hypothetical protein
MSEIVSLAGVIIAIVFMMYSIYKGLSLPIAAIISTVFIAVTSGIGIDALWDTCVDSAVVPVFKTYVGLWLFGGIMGYVYGESGASASMAFFLFGPLKKIRNPKTKIFAYLAMFMIMRVILGLTGIDSMAVMVLVLAIIIAFFKELDIPRKYISCVMVCGISAGGMLPYAPCAMNVIIPMFIPQWSASSHGGLRMIWTVAFIVLASLWLAKMVMKDQKNGEHFEMGRMQNVRVDESDPNRPHWALTFIPIIVVIVLYNFVHCSAWLSTAGGALASIILFARHLDLKDPTPQGRGKFAMFVENMNTSSMIIPLYLCLNGIMAGAITNAPAYNLIIRLCENIVTVTGPVVGYIIVSVVLVVMGNSAVFVGANLANTVFAAAGLDLVTAGTIMLAGNTVLNTLPNSAEMQVQAQLSDTPLKIGYPPIFKTTVLLTFVLMVLISIPITLGISF